MKSHHLISIFLVPIFVAGCAAVRPVTDMAAGAGGGFYLAGKESDKAYTTGYEKGRSDAVKQQYWILIHQQQEQKTLPENISLYAIPIPEQTIDGTILNPTTKYLRIEN